MKRWVLAVAVLVAVGAGVWLGRAAIFGSGTSPSPVSAPDAGVSRTLDKDDEKLNAYAIELRDATYERPTPTPGWKLEPGRAADFYKRAAGLYEPIEDFGVTIAMLTKVGDEITTVPASEAEGAVVVGGPCEPFGVKRPPSATLSVEDLHKVCRSLAANLKAIETFERGCVQRDARSPVHLWDSWALKEGKRRRLGGFIAMGFMVGLQAWGEVKESRHEDLIRRTFCWARAGHDLARGGDLLAAGDGVSLFFRIFRPLESLLISQKLSLNEAKMVLEEALYLDATDPTLRQSIIAEQHFYAFAAYTPPEGVLRPPGLGPPDIDPGWEIGQLGLRRGLMRFFESILTGFNESGVLRKKRYQKESERIDKYTQDKKGDVIFRNELDWLFFKSQMRRLAIAASIVAFWRTQKKMPASLGDLKAFFPQEPPEDPLSGEPFLVTHEDQQVYIDTPAQAKALIEETPARADWSYRNLLRFTIREAGSSK